MNWSLLLDVSANHLPEMMENDELDRQKLIEAVIGLSITAIVMSVPTYRFIQYAYYKVKKEFRFKTKFNQYNHIDALVLLSMNILRANPECFQQKCIYLKGYIVYLYPESDSFHESLKMAYNDVYHSESLVNWLKRFQSEDEQRDVIRFLVHMAAQDGIVAPREKTELFRIIDAFTQAREEWMDLIEGINREFSERQHSWRKRRHAPGESYRDDLISKALEYFGITREALDEQGLRSEYRKLVKEFHPDRHPDATPEQHNELEVKFQELQLYYEELCKLL